jgi:hypothetical protein
MCLVFALQQMTLRKRHFSLRNYNYTVSKPVCWQQE